MITRTSTNAHSNSLTEAMMKAQSNLYKTQEKAISQKEVINASDSPSSSSIIMNANRDLSNISDYLTNINTIDTGASILDSAYSEIYDKMNRINTLAISASSDTSASEGNIEAIYNEVKSLKEDIVRVANTQFNGEYIFSGASVGTEAFTLLDDGSVVYNGTQSIDADGNVISGAENNYAKKLEVSAGIYISINKAGDSVFGYSDNSGDEPTGTGIFQTLTKLENALSEEPYDSDNVRVLLDDIQSGVKSITADRSGNGVVQSRASMLKTSLEDTELMVTEQKSNVQDVDITEIYSKLSQDYYSYQASMQVTTQSMGLSLLNYI